MIPNFKEQLFEPRLPLVREGGLLERCDFRWENAPVIQLGTRTGWWGNAVNARSIGGQYADLPEEPVQADGVFLARREALALADLQQVQANVEEIVDITTSAVNPYADRVDMEATITVGGEAGEIIIHLPGEVEETTPGPPLEGGVWQSTAGGEPVLQDTAGGSPVVQDTSQG